MVATVVFTLTREDGSVLVTTAGGAGWALKDDRVMLDTSRWRRSYFDAGVVQFMLFRGGAFPGLSLDTEEIEWWVGQWCGTNAHGQPEPHAYFRSLSVTVNGVETAGSFTAQPLGLNHGILQGRMYARRIAVGTNAAQLDDMTYLSALNGPARELPWLRQKAIDYPGTVPSQFAFIPNSPYIVWPGETGEMNAEFASGKARGPYVEWAAQFEEGRALDELLRIRAVTRMNWHRYDRSGNRFAPQEAIPAVPGIGSPGAGVRHTVQETFNYPGLAFSGYGVAQPGTQVPPDTLRCPYLGVLRDWATHAGTHAYRFTRKLEVMKFYKLPALEMYLCAWDSVRLAWLQDSDGFSTANSNNPTGATVGPDPPNPLGWAPDPTYGQRGTTTNRYGLSHRITGLFGFESLILERESRAGTLQGNGAPWIDRGFHWKLQILHGMRDLIDAGIIPDPPAQEIPGSPGQVGKWYPRVLAAARYAVPLVDGEPCARGATMSGAMETDEAYIPGYPPGVGGNAVCLATNTPYSLCAQPSTDVSIATPQDMVLSRNRKALTFQVWMVIHALRRFNDAELNAALQAYADELWADPDPIEFHSPVNVEEAIPAQDQGGGTIGTTGFLQLDARGGPPYIFDEFTPPSLAGLIARAQGQRWESGGPQPLWDVPEASWLVGGEVEDTVLEYVPPPAGAQAYDLDQPGGGTNELQYVPPPAGAQAYQLVGPDIDPGPPPDPTPGAPQQVEIEPEHVLRRVVREGPLVLQARFAQPPPSEGGGPPPPSDEPRHLLFIVLDDAPALRAWEHDHQVFYRQEPGGLVPTDDTLLFPSTPWIDLLQSQGIRFKNARAAPNCSPARASFNTGVHAHRHGLGTVVRISDDSPDLSQLGDPLPAIGSPWTTIGQRLFPGGMPAVPGLFTAYIGKLHLSKWITETVQNPPVFGPGPPGLGFDIINLPLDPDPGRLGGWSFRSVMENNHNSAPVPPGVPPGNTNDGSRGSYYFYRREQQDVLTDEGTIDSNVAVGSPFINETNQDGRYSTDLFCELARDIVNEQDALGGRACVFLTLPATHSPFDLPPLEGIATEEYAGEYLFPGPDFQTNAFRRQMAIAEAADFYLSTVLWSGLTPEARARTTIIFITDNGLDGTVIDHMRDGGAPFEESPPHNLGVIGELKDDFSPARSLRFKASTHHYGTFCQMFVHGAAVVTPGRTFDGCVDVCDIMPTILDYFGLPVPPAPNFTGGITSQNDPRFDAAAIDGYSLMPVIRDQMTFGTWATTRRVGSLQLHFTPNGDQGNQTFILRTAAEWVSGTTYPVGTRVNYFGVQWRLNATQTNVNLPPWPIAPPNQAGVTYDASWQETARRDLSYEKWLLTGFADLGLFKVFRKLGGTGVVDTFYRLRDANGVPVDIAERFPLPTAAGQQYRDQYVNLIQEMLAILGSQLGQGGSYAEEVMSGFGAEA